MSVIKRYQATIQGELSITGNTLGLAGDANGDGVLNFTTASPAPPSGGTTTTWANNSSAAFLALPAGAEVTYAELTWGAQFNSTISAGLNTPITFTTPLGSNTIAPDPTTSQSVTTSAGENFYLRSQNVTSLISAAGAGEYIVGGVPSLITGFNNYVGWNLIVAYKLMSVAYRNITIWSLLQHIQGSQGNVSVPISGFATPVTGAVTARLVVAAGGGNPNLQGDFMQFGPSSTTVATLSGPNNIATNFFASQINNNTGLLDTTGTWGTKNTVPPSQATIGNRNSYDITNVNASAGLTNNQTSAVVVFGTLNDTYDGLALGLQVDSNAPLLTPIVKNVDKAFADVGDTLTYTVVFQNKGLAAADNTLFVDTLPTGISFVPNSLLINGTTSSGNPASPGVSLGSIVPNQVMTLSFKTIVTTIPNPNSIINTAEIDYNFLPGVGLTSIPANVPSNTVSTTVRNASVIFSKQVDKSFSFVGDTLTYSIRIANSGNISTNNLVLIDTIPNGTTFIANSVTINGITQNGAVVSPPTGLNVGNIPSGGVTTVTFEVVVATIPSPNPIPNNGGINYSYTVDPSLPTMVTVNGSTNIVNTQINTAIVGTTKSVSANNILVGDTVTYTMVLRNSGNTTANAVKLTDTIPSGGTFVTDSVTVNGVTQTGINPQTNGVVIPTLPIGGVATVTFQVGFSTIPNPNPVPNTAVANYDYLLDSSTPTNKSAAQRSNTVTTFVNPNTNPLKGVSKTSATVGDTLVYFLQWSNTTNITETNVIFVDTLPDGVTFVPNSITINGISQPGATITPPNGINAGTLPLNSTVSITYRVIINTIPNPNPIPNTASTTLTDITTRTLETNEVFTQVNYAEITQAPKSVDRAFSTIGETLTYTITLFNNGNTTANNVVILDTMPTGTSFNINSVEINGVNQQGAVVAPPTGLTLSCIPAGTAATITFIVTVQSIPVPNPTSNMAAITYNFVVNNDTGQTQSSNINTNTVSTTIVDATIVSTKSVNKSFAQVGDTLTYTVVLTATGNTKANNAVFLDSLPSTLTYVPGSFSLNGTAVAGANPAPPGQSIGSLTIPAIYTVTFSAVVNTIPKLNPISNTAQTAYVYTVEPTIANGRTRVSPTRQATTTVAQASLGGITKTVDRVFADCGDTITYTLEIPNSGNVTATNVIFKDTVPSGTVLVVDSVTINGIPQTGASPQTGVSLGSIAPGTVTTVVFKVVVQC